MKNKKDAGAIKNQEILNRILESKDFNNLVRAIRKNFGIPANGMKFKYSDNPDEDELLQWMLKNEETVDKIFKEISQLSEILFKERVHYIQHWELAIFEYVMTDEIPAIGDTDFGCILLERYPESVGEAKTLLSKAVSVCILPHASQRDVIRFIKNNWETIEFYNKFEIVDGKIQPRKDVFETSQIGGIDLFDIRRRKKATEHKKIYQLYKDGYIKSNGTLNAKKSVAWAGLGFPPQNPDNIRKVIHTQKKLSGD